MPMNIYHIIIIPVIVVVIVLLQQYIGALLIIVGLCLVVYATHKVIKVYLCALLLGQWNRTTVIILCDRH